MFKPSPKPSAGRVQEVAASAFKATCLELMDDIARTGREVVVTKHGRPVVRVSAAASSGDSPVAFLRGTIVRHGDIVSADDSSWDLSVTDPLGGVRGS